MTDNQKAIINSDSSFKEIRLVFPNHEIEDIENDRVYLDDMSIEESIFDGDAITFGDCNSSIFKIRVADFDEDVKGARMNVYVHYTNEELGEVDVTFGKYIVADIERTADRRWRDITATDYMTLFDVDIANWYNTTLFPSESTKRTVKQIRTMLCTLIGVTQQSVDLVNDTLQIGKSIEPQTLSARELLRCCCEVNGCFGHFNWSGVLEYVKLETDGLYPSTTLYPSSTLFPKRASSDTRESETILTYKQDGCQYADYNVAKIDSVGIMKEDGDLSVHADITPNYTNRYNIIGNILLYGFSTIELQNVARTLLTEMGNITYTPNMTEIYGGIYMKLGQEYSVKATTYIGSEVIDKTFSAYLLKRTITGIQSMSQILEANGQEYQHEIANYGIENQYKILNGKSASYKRDLESLEIEYHDFEEQTNSRFIQTSEQIMSTVARTQNIWDEENLNIKYRNYAIPKNIYTLEEFEQLDFHDGDLYLDVNTGKVYRGIVSSATETSVSVSWTIVNTLQKAQENLATEIIQTSESISSSASKSSKTWVEENPTTHQAITIDYYGYGQPPTTPDLSLEIADAELNNLYLDGEEGKVYKVTNIEYEQVIHGQQIIIIKHFTWTYQYTLQAQVTELSSRIEQTAESITSTVAEATSKYDESSLSEFHITINKRGYGQPTNVSDVPYLDQETGDVWQYNSTRGFFVWRTLPLITSELSSQITQHANEIVLSVDNSGNVVSVALTGNRETGGTNFIVNADNISLAGKTFNLTSDDINIVSDNFSVNSNGDVVMHVTANYLLYYTGGGTEITTDYSPLGVYDNNNYPEPTADLLGSYIVILESGSTDRGFLYICEQSGGAYRWKSVTEQSSLVYVHIEEAEFNIDNLNGVTIKSKQFEIDELGNASFNGAIQGSEITGVDVQTNTLQVKDSFDVYYHYVEEGYEEDRVAATFYGHETGGDQEYSVLDIDAQVLQLNEADRAIFNCAVYADSYNNLSDSRIKENIEQISADYEKAYYEIQPVVFNYIGKTERELGMIAQDLESLLIKHNISKNNCFIKKIPDEKLGMKYTLDYTKFIPYNIHMIQKQHDEIGNLKDELATLKEQVASLMKGGIR